jgi:hypothetical protein
MSPSQPTTPQFPPCRKCRNDVLFRHVIPKFQTRSDVYVAECVGCGHIMMFMEEAGSMREW